MGNSGDEDAIAAVRGAEGGSRKAIPLRVIPALGQPPENFGEELSVMEREEGRHILNEHVGGSKNANASEHLSPKRSLGMAEALPAAGGRDALARKPAGEDGDSGSVSANCSDVVVDGNSGEPLPKDPPPELVLFAEPGVLESGEVEAVVEEAGAGEESSDIQGLTPPAPVSIITVMESTNGETMTVKITAALTAEARDYYRLCDEAEALGIPTSLDDPASPTTVDGLRAAVAAAL